MITWQLHNRETPSAIWCGATLRVRLNNVVAIKTLNNTPVGRDLAGPVEVADGYNNLTDLITRRVVAVAVMPVSIYCRPFRSTKWRAYPK